MYLLPLLTLVACHPEPGDPDYPEPGPLGSDTDEELLGGPDPYEAGDDRLSLGIFYETGYSELIPLDHYYVYDNTFGTAKSDERIEGYESDVIIRSSNQAWWGGGVHWDTPQDLSDWTTLYVSLYSEDGFANVDIKMVAGPEVAVVASTYGYTNDGEWHHLEIPLSAFSGANLTNVTVPLILGGVGPTDGDELLVDNFYFTQD